MKEIKFNRNYKKLHNQKYAKLIFVALFYGKNLSKDFIEYDTDGKYKIEPETEYIYLCFMGNKMIPFTTLRKNTPENWEKYVKNQEQVKIVIEGKKEEEPLPNHWVPM